MEWTLSAVYVAHDEVDSGPERRIFQFSKRGHTGAKKYKSRFTKNASQNSSQLDGSSNAFPSQNQQIGLILR
jgi:hypothetical protein